MYVYMHRGKYTCVHVCVCMYVLPRILCTACSRRYIPHTQTCTRAQSLGLYPSQRVACTSHVYSFSPAMSAARDCNVSKTPPRESMANRPAQAAGGHSQDGLVQEKDCHSVNSQLHESVTSVCPHDESNQVRESALQRGVQGTVSRAQEGDGSRVNGHAGVLSRTLVCEQVDSKAIAIGHVAEHVEVQGRSQGDVCAMEHATGMHGHQEKEIRVKECDGVGAEGGLCSDEKATAHDVESDEKNETDQKHVTDQDHATEYEHVRDGKEANGRVHARQLGGTQARRPLQESAKRQVGEKAKGRENAECNGHVGLHTLRAAANDDVGEGNKNVRALIILRGKAMPKMG
jgi:hypothetical protein